jgi:pSer/pThr/pTyr-binding forkhead associated (FHA) protein
MDAPVGEQPALGVRSGGELHGRVFQIRAGTQVIGRHPDCELRIDDASVSRRHAVVIRDRNAVSIEDRGSTNGTSVNGERLVESRRSLRSGDLVRIGGIDLVYLAGSETPARRAALLEPETGARDQVPSRSAADETPPLQPEPPATPPPSPQPRPEPSPLTPAQLGLSGAASAVTALLLSGLHVDRLGATIAAGLTAVITTFLQARGRKQWLRVGGGAGLALVLAVTGITVPELALGRALTDPNRSATFLPPGMTPSTPTPSTAASTAAKRTSGPGISIHPNPDDCGPTPVGHSSDCPITVQSTGSAPLRVTSVEGPAGTAAGEFEVPPDVPPGPCPGKLAPGESCQINVTFRPTLAQRSSARLIVHQNLPKPDTGTTVELTGEGLGEPSGTAPTTTGP